MPQPTEATQRNPKGKISAAAYEKCPRAGALPCSNLGRTLPQEGNERPVSRTRLPSGGRTNRAQERFGKETEERLFLFCVRVDTKDHLQEPPQQRRAPGRTKNSCGPCRQALLLPVEMEWQGREAQLAPRKPGLEARSIRAATKIPACRACLRAVPPSSRVLGCRAYFTNSAVCPHSPLMTNSRIRLRVLG